MDRRTTRLTPGFHRARQRLGLATGSTRGQAVAAVIRALASAETLPEHGDFETEFKPGHAFVRRVPKHNPWIWYRVDAAYVTLVSITDDPQAPAEKT